MKFTIEKSNFLGVLASTKSIVHAKNTIPILGNLLLSASELGLQVSATDLDMWIETSIECGVEHPGTVTVNATKLFDVVRNLSSERSINVEQKDNYLSVSQGRSRFRLDTLPHDDFPPPLHIRNGMDFNINANSLNHMISKVLHAASNEEIKYTLNGVYFHIDNENINAVALDGYRLGFAAEEIDAKFQPFILPNRAATEILKLTDKLVSDIDICVGDNGAKFTMNDTIISTKLIDGTYPDYQRIIPDNDIIMITGKEELVSAINRVVVLSDGLTRQVSLSIKDNKISVSTTGAGHEEARDEVDCDLDGEYQARFNSKYLLEALSQISNGLVRFEFGDESVSPVILRDNSNDVDNEFFVVMPTKVR